MNRRELEQCAWDNTPADERRDRTEHRVLPKFGTRAGRRVKLSEERQRVRKLTGNNREVRVFDPSGSTPGSMSPWMPLWALFNDELMQRCEDGREPKMRPPYNRSRRDYKSSIENGSSSTTRHHATKKSPAQLQREIDEVLASPGSHSYEEAMDALEKKHAGVKRGGSLRAGHVPAVPKMSRKSKAERERELEKSQRWLVMFQMPGSQWSYVARTGSGNTMDPDAAFDFGSRAAAESHAASMQGPRSSLRAKVTSRQK